MGGGHDHGSGAIRHERPLWWAFGLTTVFLVAEVVGGLMTNSLALLSDAAHMGTDVIALAISLVAVRTHNRPRRSAYVPSRKSLRNPASGTRSKPSPSKRASPRLLAT